MNGVSIIICCYNSSQRLLETLAHLKAQVVPEHIPWEVIVVDNASTDSTGQIAQTLWGEWPGVPFWVVQEPKPGLMNARLKGFESAQYEFVSFIDDDNWVAENWVQTVYEKMLEYPQAGAIGGQAEAVFESEPPEWFEKYRPSYAVGEQAAQEGELPNGHLLWGAGISFRKSVWNKILINGFQPILYGRKGTNLTAGDDSEICFAFLLSGYMLVYSPSLMVRHFMPKSRLNWRQLCLTTRGFGKSDPYLQIYNKFYKQFQKDEKSPTQHWLRIIISLFSSLLKDRKILFLAIMYKGEGNNQVIATNRKIGNLIERCKLMGSIRKLEQKIHQFAEAQETNFIDKP